MTDAVKETIDFVVAQRGPVLVRLKLGSQSEVGNLHVHCGKQLIHGGARAGTRIADVEALALEIGEALDVRFLARHDGKWLRMHREHRAQLEIGRAHVWTPVTD